MFFHAPPSESLSPSLAASIREAALDPLVLGFRLSGQVGGGLGIKITRLDQGHQGGPDRDGDGHGGQVVEDRGPAHQSKS